MAKIDMSMCGAGLSNLELGSLIKSVYSYSQATSTGYVTHSNPGIQYAAAVVEGSGLTYDSHGMPTGGTIDHVTFGYYADTANGATPSRLRSCQD